MAQGSLGGFRAPTSAGSDIHKLETWPPAIKIPNINA